MLGMIPRMPLERVLEIGGGEFGTLLTLKHERNFEAWGLDIRMPAAALDHVIVGSVTNPDVRAKLPSATFDLVIANDVLEHVEDTATFVDVVHQSLKIGGLAAISVPNIRQVRLLYHVMIMGRFPREDAGLFDRTHLRWFCKADVIEAFSNTHFELIVAKSVGRFVPEVFTKSVFGELLGLQNLFIFKKR